MKVIRNLLKKVSIREFPSEQEVFDEIEECMKYADNS